MPSTAISVLCETPSVSSTYSCGRLASTAVMVMRPIRISSRMRSFVRKSSFSFPAAISLPPCRAHCPGLREGLQAKIAPRMSKAFVREEADSDHDVEGAAPQAPTGKNYITPEGFARLQREKKQL